MRLLLPNQLFHAGHPGAEEVVVVHDPVLFGYSPPAKGGSGGYPGSEPFAPVHKAKLAYMLAAAEHYRADRAAAGASASSGPGSVRVVPPERAEEFYRKLKSAGAGASPVVAYDPLDRLVEARWRALGVRVEPSPSFVLSPADGSVALRLGPVYDAAREKTGIMVGAKSTDAENRAPPDAALAAALAKNGNRRRRRVESPDAVAVECARRVERLFPGHFGQAAGVALYPVTRLAALAALRAYARDGLGLMRYQDAIVAGETFGTHSALSAAINVGLLGPAEVCRHVVDRGRGSHSDKEAFVRQVLGWRELCALAYRVCRADIHAMFPLSGLVASAGRPDMPASWYAGDTGVPPLDDVVAGGRSHAYAHHINRLMVALNLGVLAGAPPIAMYRWFVTVLAIDAYDWVMVANLGIMGYGLAGIARKPYVSSSAYVLRMSDHEAPRRAVGPSGAPTPSWAETWDALFYNHVASRGVPYFRRVLLGRPYLERGAAHWARLAAAFSRTGRVTPAATS